MGDEYRVRKHQAAAPTTECIKKNLDKLLTQPNIYTDQTIC